MTRLALALCVVSSALFGCVGGGSGIQRTYFSFKAPTEASVERYVRPRYPVQIRIRRFDTPTAYDRQEIVYRSSAYELRYYWYRLWVTKPKRMLTELVGAYLRASNLVSEVVYDIAERLPDYVLESEITAIEEINASDGRWFAHLGMRFSLQRFESRKIVWQHDFDVRKPVYTRDPIHVVKVLSDIYEEQMAVVVERMDRYLEGVHDAPAPPPGRGFAAAEGAEPGITSDPVRPGASARPRKAKEPTARRIR